jgi:hypothetical protein
MTIYYVYQYVREDLTPYYVGKGKEDRAWVPHKRSNGSDIKPKDKSRILIIKEGLTEEEAFDLETNLIKKYGLKSEGGILVNMTYGGEGRSPGEELRKHMSEILKGRKKPPRTKEHTEKIAARFRGKPNLKTSIGLRKYHDSKPDRSHIIKKQSESVKEWHKRNPDAAAQRAIKVWDTRYKNQYNEYRKAIDLVNLGKGCKTIKKETGMFLKQESIEKLRSGTHRIYELFPDLKLILSV